MAFVDGHARAQWYRTFNIKILYCTAAGLFVVGSVLCGAAPNMDAIIVGRVISGIGGQGEDLRRLRAGAPLTTSLRSVRYYDLYHTFHHGQRAAKVHGLAWRLLRDRVDVNRVDV